MAFVFGAAATDDISVTRSAAIPSNWMFCGWVFPTTLTATRCYFGSATVGTTAIAVGGTTSELKITLDCVTTDAVFDTTGAGIVVNVWQFIAIVSSASASTSACRAWVGTLDVPPVEVTVTNTVAQVGSVSAVADLTIGNQGSTASLAFQGSIDQCVVIAGAGVSNFGPLYIASAGAIAQNEADEFKQATLIPIWAAETGPELLRQPSGATIDLTLFDLSVNPPQTHHASFGGSAKPTPQALTVSGATFTEDRGPRVSMAPWPALPQRRRR